jgi:hypothetical protein
MAATKKSMRQAAAKATKKNTSIKKAGKTRKATKTAKPVNSIPAPVQVNGDVRHMAAVKAWETRRAAQKAA